FVLRTTKPFDWAGSVKKWFPRAEKTRHAGRDYVRMPWKLPFGDPRQQAAIFVPDDRTLVFGDEHQVRKLLARLKAGGRGPTPPPGWKEFERDLIALAFDARTVPCVSGDWPTDPPEAKHARTLVEGVRVLAAGVTVGERTEVRVRALARD